mgnify:CR=1 FL=1
MINFWNNTSNYEYILEFIDSTNKMEEDGNQKKHRKRQAGPKAEKKKAKSKHQQELTPQQRNPKAFAIQHAQKTAKLIRR